MTMVVDFADGFTSNSSPNLLGLGNEIYLIDNNHSGAVQNFTGLNFNGYTSVFASYEIERFNTIESYRQTGTIIFRYDTVNSLWVMEFGTFIGDDLLKDSVALPQEVVITITSTGQVQYMSGNMNSFGYSGKFKLNLNRINA
jgi:hypothetical protein